MDSLIKKMKNDKKYSAKVQLIVLTSFFVIVMIYTSVSSRKISSSNDSIDNIDEVNKQEVDILKIPNNYREKIEIIINDNVFNYEIVKKNDEYEIKKNDVVYIYKNNSYYKLINNHYIMTSEDDIYDIIDKNYISLNTISNYLEKAIKENNQYIIKIKDILVIDNKTDDYFIITVNNNKIFIDYTPLMNSIGNEYSSFVVKIKIEELE